MPDKSKGFSCLNKSYCKRQMYNKLDKILIVPFEAEDAELIKLMSFFLYLAPNISSVHAPNLPDKNKSHDLLLDKMLSSRGFNNSNKDFCSSNCKISEHLKKLALEDNSICLKCKRFVCKRSPSKNGSKETDLNCLLRHIRNSIAHGLVYYRHVGNNVFIMFEDLNTSKTISARIVCTRADLSEWKKILKSSSVPCTGNFP